MRSLVRFLILAALISVGIAGCVHYTPRPLVPQQTAAMLESRSLNEPGLREFIERSLGRPWSEWPPKSWNLELLTLVAFYNSPDLDVERARWSAAQAGVITAGTRPNPSLSATALYSTNPPKGVSPWFPAIAFDVPIETAGKRGRRLTQARQLSEAARWNIMTTAWGVRRNLTSALLDDAVARQREGLLTRQLDVLNQIVQLQEGELAAGAVPVSDVTLARIQLAKTRLELQTARAQVAEGRARTAAALGVPLHALDGAELSWRFEPMDAAELTSAAARRGALTGRSDVQGALAEYEASQAALQLEVARQYPDIRLGPGYQWTEGENQWSLGLTLELPVFNRNRGPIAEAEAHRTEAAGRFVALQAKIIHEVDAAVATLEAADGAALAGEKLLASQRENLEGVEGQFRAGAVGSLEVASARLDAITAEALVLESSARRQQALRALEDAVQRPLGSAADAQAVVLQIESTQRSP